MLYKKPLTYVLFSAIKSHQDNFYNARRFFDPESSGLSNRRIVKIIREILHASKNSRRGPLKLQDLPIKCCLCFGEIA